MKNQQKDKNFFCTNFDIKSMSMQKMIVDENGTQSEVEEFTFEGLASTFGNIDLVDDIIERGAFRNSINRKNSRGDSTIKLLAQHNALDFPIGRIREITEVEKGLFIKAAMPMADMRVSGIIVPQMKAGSLDSMSIGFKTVDADTNNTTGIRTIKEADLFEISLVTFPANPEAMVTGMKSKFGIDDVERIASKKDFEDLLRSTGTFSRKACAYLTSRFRESQSDSGDINSKKHNVQSESVNDAMGELDGLVNSIKKLTTSMRY